VRKDDRLSRHLLSLCPLPAAGQFAGRRSLFSAMREALHVSGLLLYEFRQSLRFHVWLHQQDPRGVSHEPTATGRWRISNPIWTAARWSWRRWTGRTCIAWPNSFRIVTPARTDTGRWTCCTSPRRCTWMRGVSEFRPQPAQAGGGRAAEGQTVSMAAKEELRGPAKRLPPGVRTGLIPRGIRRAALRHVGGQSPGAS